jgi:alkaline phosphatase
MEQNALFHVIAQNTDAIRAELCAIGACDANGIPVKRPTREQLLQLAAKSRP